MSRSSMFNNLRGRFVDSLGMDAVTGLVSLNPQHRVITIAGDQCTGKSTLAKRLARELDGIAMSAGLFFREEAARRGVSVAALSKLSSSDPSIDVRTDYAVVKTIAESAAPLTIIEGRQPAVMAAFVRTVTTCDVVSVYLKCSYKEQALRFVERESGQEAAKAVSDYLSDTEFKSLIELSDTLRAYGGLDQVCDKLTDTANRDADDQARYAEFYGPELDYQNPDFYDIILDTTPNQPADTFLKAIQELKRFGYDVSSPASKL